MFIINENTIAHQYNSGIKLSSNRENQTGTNAENLLNFPFNSYFLDQESRVVAANECVAKNHHLASIHDLIGRDISCLIPNKKEALTVFENDKKVRQTHQLQFLDEAYGLIDGAACSFISIKMPVYDEKKHIMGVFGCSQIVDQGISHVTAFLNALSNLGIISPQKNSWISHPYQSTSSHDGILFTKREREIINYILNGKTARSISEKLSISRRTVESHIDNIKQKTLSRTKEDLIEKLRKIYY